MKRLLLILLFVSGISMAQPPITAPSPMMMCDNNSDGFYTFDLHSKDIEILGLLNPSAYSVSYFETPADAQNNVNAIPSLYTNVSSPQTLYVRVTDLANPLSFSLTTLTLYVLYQPGVFPAEIEICDGVENDGFGTFDLSAVSNQVSFGAPGVTVTYYETVTDATYGTSPLPNVYTTITPWAQTVYARVANSNGCASVTNVQLYVYAIPTANQPPNMTVYENPSDGIATFNLTLQRDFIIGGQANTSVTFYLNQADAFAQVGPLFGCYTNTTSPQTIWATISNNITGCFAVTNFTLNVSAAANPNPAISIPDTNFKAKLLSSDVINGIARSSCGQAIKIDCNGDGQIQVDEALRVGRLVLSSSNISSLEGIMAFNNLQSLACDGNQLSQLNLSGMNQLSGLVCSGNQLTTLDLSNTHVQYLSCAGNQLVWINIKNGFDLAFPAEAPPIWGNNPTLTSVCADSFEIDTLEMVLEFNQLANVTTTSDCSLGIENHDFADNIDLYPNPSNHIVNIQSQSAIKSIEIFDMQGRKMETKLSGETNVAIDISGYESGMYFFRINTNGGIATKKVIKK